MSALSSLLAPDGQSQRARDMRRAWPVHMYVGRNGSGKSACMVYDTLPDLDAGKLVLSTVRLLDYRNPRPCPLDVDECDDAIGHARGHLAAHPCYVPFRDWGQMLDWRSGPILMDEITGVADSSSTGLPMAVSNVLAQLRRADVTVRLTGLNYIRANKRIREATSAVTRCQSLLPVTAYAEDGSQKVWKQRRLALWRTYDAQSLPLDDVSESAWEKADRLCFGRHWLPTSPAVTAYDTYDAVLTVGHVTDTGSCARCGGIRRAAPCSCSDYVAQQAEAKRATASGRTARRASAEDRTGADAPSPAAVPVAVTSGAPTEPVSVADPCAC